MQNSHYKGKGHPQFYELLDQIADLHSRKNQNYSPGKDPFSNFRESEKFGVPDWLGCLVRMGDKWNRATNLAKGHKDLVGESIKDTLMDLAVYSLICIILYDEASTAETTKLPELKVPENKPRVGIGVMILKDNKILLGKRKGSHGEGEFAFPGGHLEHLESFEQCAKREVKEECGIEIDNIKFQFLANLTKYNPKHYAHIGLIANWKEGEPQVLEPDKCENWGWFELDKLPELLFEPCRLAIKSYLTNQKYFDC